MDDQQQRRLEAMLRSAAGRYVRARARERDELLGDQPFRSLLARWGVRVDAAALVDFAAGAKDLPSPLREALRARAALELQGLVRLGRRADPRYDMNRHIAVDRMARWLDGRLAALRPPAPPRASGAELNRRFAARRHPRAPGNPPPPPRGGNGRPSSSPHQT